MSTFTNNGGSICNTTTTTTTTNNNNNNNNNNTNIINDTNEEKKKLMDLLSFSIDIISIILIQFLTLKDVGNIDTAYCNKKKRDQLLSILSNNKYIFYNNLQFDKSFTFINKLLIWFGNRKIKLLSLLSNESTDRLCSNLNDDGLLGLSRYCIHLQSLDVSSCNNISNRSMIEIGRNCIHLQSLNIRGCYNISDITMIEIGRNCIQLQSLNICELVNITDTGMIEISRNCIHLKSLGIRGCTNITDAARSLFRHINVSD
jgi:hypothetical protein